MSGRTTQKRKSSSQTVIPDSNALSDSAANDPVEASMLPTVGQLSPEALAQIASFFKVLSEPTRLQIVCALKPSRRNVTQIIQQTGLGQANVSKHLKILAQAGIVSRQQEGVSVFYEVANPTFFQLCETVCKTLNIQLYQ